MTKESEAGIIKCPETTARNLTLLMRFLRLLEEHRYVRKHLAVVLVLECFLSETLREASYS